MKSNLSKRRRGTPWRGFRISQRLAAKELEGEAESSKTKKTNIHKHYKTMEKHDKHSKPACQPGLDVLGHQALRVDVIDNGLPKMFPGAQSF